MSEALRIQHLETLLDVSQQLGSTTELHVLLERIEDAAKGTLSCERVSVFIYDQENEELYSTLATGTETLRFSANHGIAGEAATHGSIINVNDAYADPRFNRDIDKQTGFHTRNLLTLPMQGYEGDVVGVLQLLNKREGAFSADDEHLAGTLCALAGVALQRQMLLEEYAVKQRLQRDLDVARDIQQALLPKQDPSIDGYDIAGWNQPADETGGDCYDYIPVSDNRLGILLADASGHGIGPALVASECRAAIRALAPATTLSETLIQANVLLNEDLDPGRFITTFYGILDPTIHEIRYVSAGHAPLFLYRKESDSTEIFDATTFPLGIMSFLDSTPAEPVLLNPGDIFLLITDGFHEWANKEGDDFGVDRVFDVVRQHADASSAYIIKELHKAVESFGAGTEQDDDLTAVVIKRNAEGP